MLSTLVACLGFAASLANAAAVPSLETRSAGKKGLAYNDVNLCSQFTSGDISWAYNWNMEPQSRVQGREYVPMLWGPKMFSEWSKNANTAIKSGAKNLLGFNEPDLHEQSNMSPAAAAAAWREHMEPFVGKARLGAPAVTNSGTPGQGLDWLRSFLGQCSGCTIDFVPVHWYEPNGDVEYFKKHMAEAYKVGGGRKIWLTEFGVPGASPEKQAEFIKTVTPWMDAQDWIERYSYFGVFENWLLQGGRLNFAGKTYNN
ncbi:hypothetical protein FPQ18DRAFT_106351 [Pyronema domesticum]|uniref:Similar to Alkali-sensitive linkage protein 1 acc. no. Q09788 n=1 Tax=Pyronema omphalodes (strain CBS 100304) TaxID=1076935 RepID=U4KWA0_PYROM|nr:hypothetical protein FPQ18DRAFT_106351 [Pyronema domesticum]CCX05722.1 Similar to Alkali-sensitive linkage protein 1; acc. no. Q09788 [Pyronema omphalodes CBS 100304]